MKKLVLVLAAVLFLLLSAVTLVFLAYNSSPTKLPEQVLFRINRGEPVSVMARRLKEDQLIRSARFFSTVSRIFGTDRKLQAGIYRLDRSMTSTGILKALVLGKVDTMSVTIKEGYDIFDIDQALLEAGITTAKGDFLAIARSKELVSNVKARYTIKEKVTSLEGFLYPDTYVIDRGDSAGALVSVMLDRFHDEVGRHFATNRKFQKDLYRYLVIASMVEKETGVDDERGAVASVIHNRLKRGEKLRIDPTLIYALKRKGEWDGNIRRRHLYGMYRYSTYSYKGLPPGPICSPQIDSVLAAVFPDATDYLFFVARNDGTGRHMFTDNYADHKHYIELFQNRRR